MGVLYCVFITEFYSISKGVLPKNIVCFFSLKSKHIKYYHKIRYTTNIYYEILLQVFICINLVKLIQFHKFKSD